MDKKHKNAKPRFILPDTGRGNVTLRLIQLSCAYRDTEGDLSPVPRLRMVCARSVSNTHTVHTHTVRSHLFTHNLALIPKYTELYAYYDSLPPPLCQGKMANSICSFFVTGRYSARSAAARQALIYAWVTYSLGSMRA